MDFLVDADTDVLVRQILLRQEHMMTQIDDLQAAVAAEDVEIGAVLSDVIDLQNKLTNLVGQLPADEAARLVSMTDDIQAQTQKIADALTPPAPPVEEPPVVEPVPVGTTTPVGVTPPEDVPVDQVPPVTDPSVPADVPPST